MKKLFTLFLSVFLMASAFAQKPEAVALNTDVKPVLDGVLDEGVWDDCEVYNIALPFTGETPTLGDEGETNFRVLWDDEGIYVFITVTDDVLIPNFANTGTAYMYDFPEITFDVNYILDDGQGPQEGNGHYQIDTRMLEGDGDGTPKTNPGPEDLETVAFLIDGTNYTAEYLIPFEQLINADGGLLDKTAEIGFDVYISDNDNDADLNAPVRNRAVWTNQGEVTQAWDNMDNCGILLLDGAEGAILIDEIEISADDITENGQTMQIEAIIDPEDAEDKRLKYILTSPDGGMVRATISEEGVITPVIDETIVIVATSSDDFIFSNEITVNISGQVPTMASLNYIKDGFFDNVDSTGGPSDVWYGMAAGEAMVVDGVLEYAQTELPTNIYDNGVKQWIDIPYARKDENFIFSFKAWADADRTFQCKIEDQANGWQTFGVCAAPETDGTSFWPAANMSITTTPTVYTFELTWANMAENKNIQFNWQLGDDITKIYLDSVYIIAEADLALIPTAISQQRAMERFKVYPNPASSKLHVEFSTPNTRVAIYNSVGIKMDEAVVYGTHHMFDVSRYSKGMYFVKANDAVVKFVK